MGIFITLYFFVAFFLCLAWMFMHFFFHARLTDEVIRLLYNEGFIDLSNKLCNIINTFGKVPYARKNIWLFFNAWDEFYKLKIPKEMKKLYSLHLIYRITRIMAITLAVLILVPFTCFLIFIVISYITINR